MPDGPIIGKGLGKGVGELAIGVIPSSSARESIEIDSGR